MSHLFLDDQGNAVARTQLTGSNPQDAKAPGNGDVNALHAGYNGATWDRWRNNSQGTLLASGARTASILSPQQTNYNARGVIVYLDVTVASGTGGLQVQVQAVDPVTGNRFLLNSAPTAITATGRYAYELYPGSSAAGAAGNQFVNQRTAAALPRIWLASVTHSDTSSYTYSLGYSLIV